MKCAEIMVSNTSIVLPIDLLTIVFTALRRRLCVYLIMMSGYP